MEQRSFILLVIAITGIIVIGITDSPYIGSENNIGGKAYMQNENIDATMCTCENGDYSFVCPGPCYECCGGSENVKESYLIE